MRTVGGFLAVVIGLVVCCGSLGCSSSTSPAKGSGMIPSGMTKDKMKDMMMEGVNKMKEKMDASKGDDKGKGEDKGKGDDKGKGEDKGKGDDKGKSN